MYIEKPEEAKKFAVGLRRKARTLTSVDVVLVPSFLHIPLVVSALKGSLYKVGAQTVSEYADLKHTGEVSAFMLKVAGVSHAIVGHSERRASGESNEMIAHAVQRAQEAGLTVVLCVGEVERDHAGAYLEVVTTQLISALRAVAKVSILKLVVAYEPVWAIGKSSNEAMQPADLQEMVIFIRKTLADILGRALALRVPILYGGSCDASNAKELLVEGGVAGFLVGRASADFDSFVEILTICKK